MRRWVLRLCWIGYLWLNAHRGRMHHDPLHSPCAIGRSRMLITLMLAAAVAIQRGH